MQEPTVLRTARMGGFVKEDVLTYLDELNSKIEGLENELEKARGAEPSDPQEIIKYRNQVDNLQEKLNASNNALRATKKELEEANKEISRLKAGGAAPAGGTAQAGGPQVNAQTQAALDAAKREVENLRNQLKAEQQKNASGAGNAPASQQAMAALEAAKKEIDSLRSQLKTAEQKVSGNSAVQNELANVRSELSKTTAELHAKTSELSAKTKESADKDEKLARIDREKKEALEKKDKEIKELSDKVSELQDMANNPALQMNALFVEATKTVNKLKSDAKDEADGILKEAQEKADKTISDADETAKKTVSDAEAKAKATIEDAEKKAQNTIEDAERKAANIQDMSSGLRDALVREIESVHNKFSDIASAMNKLTNEAALRMTEASDLVSEARNAVDTGEKIDLAKFGTFEAPGKEEKKPEPVRESTPSYRSSAPSGNTAKAATVPESPKAPSEPVLPEMPKTPQRPAPKKSANFNFDMAELLKAAEEEAAKHPNG